MLRSSMEDILKKYMNLIKLKQQKSVIFNQ